MSQKDIRRDALPHKSPDIRRETSISFRTSIVDGVRLSKLGVSDCVMSISISSSAIKKVS